jgi:hypothetical protein
MRIAIRSDGRKPSNIAWISEGLGSETNPAGLEKQEKEPPPEVLRFPAGVWTGRIAVFGSSPQPSGLPNTAGRFHRGATRGELDSSINAGVEDAKT